MEYWLFGLLTFIFGYITCGTFYFMRSMRLTLVLMRASHIIYLSSIMKAIEIMAYSREIMLEYMLKSEKGPTEISSFEYRFDQDVSHLKDRSVSALKILHPPFFKNTLDFQDWETAMEYLHTHREAVYKFWEPENDRQN